MVYLGQIGEAQELDILVLILQVLQLVGQVALVIKLMLLLEVYGNTMELHLTQFSQFL